MVKLCRVRCLGNILQAVNAHDLLLSIHSENVDYIFRVPWILRIYLYSSHTDVAAFGVCYFLTFSLCVHLSLSCAAGMPARSARMRGNSVAYLLDSPGIPPGFWRPHPHPQAGFCGNFCPQNPGIQQAGYPSKVLISKLYAN
jgi:hypothetical protein